MIAKISKSGKSFYGAALYNQKKVDKGEGKILTTHNMVGTKPRQIDRYLKEISRVSATKKPVLHLALSFSEADKLKLNNAQMIAITKDYLTQMGYGHQPYIVYRHDDTAHPHVHVLSTRIDHQTGKKIDDAYEGRRSKAISDALEKKYGLVVADRQINRHQNLQNDLQKALKNAPTSLAQLNKILSKNDSTFRAKSTGRGIIYYKVNEIQGVSKRQSKHWKSSDFKAVGLDKKGLEKAFESNRKDRKQLKKLIESSFPKQGKITRSSFEKHLQKHQIHPIYATNERGIYGLSYAYRDKQFKASDLGKGHSWHHIKDRLVDASTSLSLREHLSESIVQGASIEIWQEGHRRYFESENLQLQEQLNALPYKEAEGLVELHDAYQERIYQDPLMNDRALIKELAGDDIDEYLQRQYRRQQQQQRTPHQSITH